MKSLSKYFVSIIYFIVKFCQTFDIIHVDQEFQFLIEFNLEFINPESVHTSFQNTLTLLLYGGGRFHPLPKNGNNS